MTYLVIQVWRFVAPYSYRFFPEVGGIFPCPEGLDLTSETIWQRAARAAQWARRGAGTPILSPARGLSRWRVGVPEGIDMAIWRK